MSFAKVRIDRGAMVAMLQGDFGQRAVAAAADDIAARVDADAYAHDGEVNVIANAPHEATLSAAASVTLDHPGGYAIEAKYGPLAKAARAAGYKVKGGTG